MRHKRFPVLSRLRVAWLALMTVAALAVAAVFLVPEPDDADSLVIDVPANPSTMAAAARSETEGEPVLAEGEAAADGVRVFRGDEADAPGDDLTGTTRTAETGGEVRITLPDASDDGAAEEGAAPIRTVVVPSPPRDDLIARTENGPRPKVAVGGLTPFEAYRRHVTVAADRPAIAVLVSGLGPDAALTRRALTDLPLDVSVSFVPYTRNVSDLMTEAAAAGREVVIELPMASAGIEPEAIGPAGLSTARDAEANGRRLDWLLSRSPAYPMVTNYLGRSFSQDGAAIGNVLAALKSAGLGYLDDTGAAGPSASRLDVPYARVTLLAGDSERLRQQLEAAAARAAPGDVTVVKAYLRAESFSVLEEWTNALAGRGIDLVPASTAIEAE